MKVKTVKTEWFQDYKRPSMMIATSVCDWKCDKESGECVCQNSALSKEPNFDIDIVPTIEKYLGNSITSAIIFGGLEPFKQFEDIYEFIQTLRNDFNCEDTVVIYTGYYPDEIRHEIERLKQFKNIVVKFGRYLPGHTPHYDSVLGVSLASDNQFAEEIS